MEQHMNTWDRFLKAGLNYTCPDYRDLSSDSSSTLISDSEEECICPPVKFREKAEKKRSLIESKSYVQMPEETTVAETIKDRLEVLSRMKVGRGRGRRSYGRHGGRGRQRVACSRRGGRRVAARGHGGREGSYGYRPNFTYKVRSRGSYGRGGYGYRPKFNYAISSRGGYEGSGGYSSSSRRGGYGRGGYEGSGGYSSSSRRGGYGRGGYEGSGGYNSSSRRGGYGRGGYEGSGGYSNSSRRGYDSSSYGRRY